MLITPRTVDVTLQPCSLSEVALDGAVRAWKKYDQWAPSTVPSEYFHGSVTQLYDGVEVLYLDLKLWSPTEGLIPFAITVGDPSTSFMSKSATI